MAIARYFGGKGGDALQRWILSYFPPSDKYDAYLEPFCGLGSVLLAKPFHRSHREIIADLYPPNINLLIQARSHPIPLVGAINDLLADLKDSSLLKIWVRNYPIFGLGDKTQIFFPVKEAAEYWLYCQCSFRGGGLRWNTGASPAQCKRFGQSDFRVRFKTFQEFSDRLMNVEIRLMDGLELLDQILEGTPRRFIYCDPPYPMEVRKSKDSRHKDKVKALSRRQYAIEFENQQHEQLRKKLDGTLSLVSSYPSQLYESLYQGWLMVVYQPKQQRRIIYRDQESDDLEQFEDGGQSYDPFTKSHKLTETPECLYISPELEKVLQQGKPDLLENAIRVGEDKII